MAQAEQKKGTGHAPVAPATPATPALEATTPVENEEMDSQKAESLQEQLQQLITEATRISALDPMGAAKLLRNAQNLMKTQGVALKEKTLARMDVHKKEIVEVLQGAYEQIRDYVKEQNLPAMNLTIGVGFTGTVDAELLNGPNFSWAGTSIKPMRIRTGHKRSGTLSKDGNKLGTFDSATAAAKARNISLVAKNKETGKTYDIPATKALKDAGFTWEADAA